MMIGKSVILYLLAVLPLSAIGQTYSQRFDEALNQRDTSRQKQLLQEWRANKPKDADLPVAYFNFFKQRYEAESDPMVKNEFLSKALSHIDAGIAGYPNRLDMPLLKIALLGEVGRYETYTQTILAVLDRNDVVTDGWLWKRDASLVDATDFLLQYVDNFVVQLYNLQDESLHPYMDRISTRVLRSYPTHIPSLSNLAITALYHKDYEKGIGYLEKSLSVDSTNTSVLSNLAYAYGQIGQTETAIAYYQEVIKYGDAQTQDYAKKQIEKLADK